MTMNGRRAEIMRILVARRALDSERRATWSFSPVTRKVENKKHYDRKKSARVWKDDFGMSVFCLS